MQTPVLGGGRGAGSLEEDSLSPFIAPTPTPCPRWDLVWEASEQLWTEGLVCSAGGWMAFSWGG